MAVTLYIRLSLLLVFLGMAELAQGQSMGNWSNTGPVNFPVNQSGQVHGIGRVSQIKFHPTNAQKIYAVSASGGVYLTSNNGVSWAPMPGTEVLPQTSNSAICINYNNDQTLYLCLGDADYFSNNYGIYKSMNGGLTWVAANSGVGTNMAVEILMDPSDTNKLVAATRGGIYRTINGGTSWSLVQAGTFRDMKAKRVTGSQTLYAATATAFYYSTDFGATWTSVTSGLSTIPGSNGGMRIAVTPSDTSRVYLATTGGNGVVFSSTTSGTSFTQVYNSSTQCLVCYDASVTSGSQGNYNFDINAHPTKPNELLLIAHNVWRSTNGGVTWSKRTSWWNECHTDMHQIEWNPYNTSQIWNANDGGMWMCTDTFATLWNPRSDGLAATEIYHASQSPVIRELISIGTQDNGELYFNSTGWKTNRGGDWTYRSAIDYRSGGNVWYMETGDRRTLVPLGSDQPYNSPLAIVTGTFSTNNARMAFVRGVPTTAFLAKDTIYRSMNTAATTPTWTLLKASAATVRDIVSCSADSNILYVAATPNILFRTDNALAATPTWTTLTTPASVSNTGSITTTRNNANVVFMSCGPSVYRSVDKGVTWTNITGTGLSGLNIRRIIHDDYSTKQRLFVNAGAYLHYKDSTVTTWTNHSANAGMPTVANGSDLMIYNDGTVQSILRLATYGRGVWQCNINDNQPPVVAFSVNNTSLCIGDTARFTHSVTGGFTSLAWSFPGGSPSSSGALAPIVVYSTPGIYTVTLIATNAFGSDTLIKTAYIAVSTGSKLQLAEGFEVTGFPPAGWQTQIGTGWVQTTTASGFGASTKSILWDNYGVDGAGVPDGILSPRLNLTGITNARLKFDVAYAPYSTTYPDSLRIRISTNCGLNWTTIYSKMGTALATAPTKTSSIFVPTSSQWRTDSVSLVPYIGNTVIVSFENIGHYGQALYLDNINIRMSPNAAFGANDTTICQGDQVNFSDSSINATSWAWTFTGGTPATSTAQNPVVTYNSAGNHTVRLIAINSLSNDTLTRTAHIHVDTRPVVNLGNDTALCPAATITLDAGNPGSAYLFSNAATSQSIAVSTAGIYSVRVTAANGCIGRDTINISAGTNPTVNLGNDTTLCPGSTITLNAGNPGSSYLYSNSAVTQTTAISSPGTYSARVINSSGCVGRDTIIISAGVTPIVNLGNDTALCPGTSITLNAGNPGSSYLYSNSATTQTTLVSTAGSFSVRVTNSSGCIGRDTIIIGAKTSPIVNLGNDTALCPAATITLNAGNPGSAYLFSNAATSQSIAVAAAGIYSVRVTATNGCIGRDTINISAATAPIVNLGSDATLCPGSTITLNAGNPGSSYLYSNSAVTQTAVISSSGTYSVRVTNSSGCIGRDTIVISTGTAPIVNLGNDTSLCAGAGITLNAGNPGSSYLYSNSATTQTTLVSTAGVYSVRVTNSSGCIGRDTITIGAKTSPVVNLGNDTALCPAATITLNAGNPGSSYLFSNAATSQSIAVSTAGNYSVVVTAANGCVGRDTINISAATNPTVNLGSDAILCSGSTITLNAGNPGSSYLYSNSATAQTTVVSIAGTYSVRVTNSSGCIGRDTIVLTAATSPIVNLGNDTSLCPGASTILNAGNPGSSYLYSNSATTQTTLVGTAGSYSVRVTNSSGCIGRDTIIVTALTNPIVNLGNDTALCPAATITLNAGKPGSSYLFSNAATSQSIAVASAGIYSVMVTASNGCIGRDTINIIAGSNPTVNLGNDTTLCSGSTITLNAGNPGSNYLYSNSATTQTTLVSTAGSYSVRVTNSSGCIGRDTIIIAGSTSPVVNLGNDTTLCPGSAITLNAGNPGNSYLYSNSATTQATTVSSSGTYSVRVTNSAGCTGRDTIIISAGTKPSVNLGNDTALCPGVTITLNAGNAGSSFLYNTGATTQTITGISAGSYSVTVTNSQLCIGRDTIIITSAPNPTVNLGKDTALCAGTTIILDAGNPGSTYLYNNGATTRTVNVTLTGVYIVVVTSPQKCKGTDTISIRSGVIPSPVITASGALLSTGTAAAYQWFLNGVAIPGATGSSYQATQSGNYTVQVKSADGCFGTSSVFAYTPTGVDNVFLLTSFDLYPNPNSGAFTITASGLNAGSIKLRCYNTAGQLVRDEVLAFTGGKVSFKVDWSALPAGEYNIQVQAGSNAPMRRKLVIQ